MFAFITRNPKTFIAAILIAAAVGYNSWRSLAVDVFPDVSVPRVTIMTEAGGLSAEEVEQLVTIPIESVMNGIPGATQIRSSSSGGLSFVWVDFEWDVDVSRARFDVFDRLSRVKDILPEEAHAEIAPVVSVTGEIMLVALTSDGRTSDLEVREIAEYDLRTRLMAVPGIGEVAVMGARLPEFRVAVDPVSAAQFGLSLFDIMEAARSSRTFLSGGYLANVSGDEVPLRQIARADTLEAIRSTPIPREGGGSLRLGDVAEVSLAGMPRRGSASFNGREAVVLSVQKAPGGNTIELTAALEKTLAQFAASVKSSGIEVHSQAYKQADFIASSISGGGKVVRDAVLVVIAVLLLTLLELRTLVIVLVTMPISVLLGVAVFPMFGLGVNVMTLGGFAVAAGDIVDAAIIFTEVIRRKLGENALLDVGSRRPEAEVIVKAARSVAPGVLFSTFIVILVFIPLLMLSGLEGRFFRPLALSYICIFTMSLVASWIMVPALSKLLRLGRVGKSREANGGVSFGIRVMRAVYAPFLSFALRFPKTVLFVAVVGVVVAVKVAIGFGSSFLPPFREDSFNVMLSLPPGASLAETERICEACVPALKSIPGVFAVTRRTGRAERDQHAEPVSSSEFVVRVDASGDSDAVRNEIRERLGDIPGASLFVGYPIAHRISAVLSGTEAELAVNIFGENPDVLRERAALMKKELEQMPEVADLRANREITVRTLRIDYDFAALAEAGITPREAGEQVSAAFNGVEVGEIRNGIRRRSLTVRLAGDENSFDANSVSSLILSGRSGKRVKLCDVATIVPEEAPNLMLREGGRRKALISCNPAPGVDVGSFVEKLRERLSPIAAEGGCTVSFGGSYEARERAAKRLLVVGSGLIVAIFFILVFALGNARSALLVLLNVPLALIGSVVGVATTENILSVSSLVGFVTVIGFTLRNGILLLNCYRARMDEGADLITSVREGSMERMAPIILTSLTTVLGLVPIVLAAKTPGGELLAPLGVVQFGGLVGATLLNLVVLPAAAIVFGLGGATLKVGSAPCIFLITVGLGFSGCKSYESKPIDWEEELRAGVTNEIRISSPQDAATLALVANREINALRLKAATSSMVAKEVGWWEDPELDFDILRIVNPAEYPLLGGGSIAFTIPLSGALACEKKAAEMYAYSDKVRIVAKERDLASKARKSAIRLAALHKTRRILESFDTDPRIARAREDVEKLHDAGEVTVEERARMRRSVHSRRHALMDVTREISEEETVLLKTCGLRPGAKLVIDFLPQKISADEINPIDVRSLIHHPEVELAVSMLGGAEAQLEAEIRRQYPDLKLGPAYANEEGLDRFGIVAGVTLPLWNRNRKAIAEASATREMLRLEAIDVWRGLVCEAASAYATLVHLAGHPPVPSTEIDEADKLADAGELTPLDYLTVREEILDQKLSEAEWLRDIALAAAEFEKFK